MIRSKDSKRAKVLLDRICAVVVLLFMGWLLGYGHAFVAYRDDMITPEEKRVMALQVSLARAEIATYSRQAYPCLVCHRR